MDTELIPPLNILYEDNHLIAVNKLNGELVQQDKQRTDPSLEERVKTYIKHKYHKPGEVFLGVIHRLDRPVSGVVLLARTSKALVRMNEQFKSRLVSKIYWAIVEQRPPKEADRLEHYIYRDGRTNRSYICKESHPDAQRAVLSYRYLAASERYHLLEVQLETGRHHQIRCQLSAIGCHIKGDLKYGAARSNPGGGISLHARSLSFTHPITKQTVDLIANPTGGLWHIFSTQ